jgi:gentisate 1,2-dioxygenase
MTVSSATSADRPAELPRELREAMREAHMVPIWESPTAYKPDGAREPAHLWPWRTTRSIMFQTGAVSSPTVVERRVLSLVNPKSQSPVDEATAGCLNAALQMLLPHEAARPHRHSMNALRFVLEGSGAETIVDGKACSMRPGDLITTPGWCWHEHVAGEGEPTIWMDVLDFALHLFLGTFEFEPGPARNSHNQIADTAFSTPNILPCVEFGDRAYSPVFRYPLADATNALASAPIMPDGTRRVRYANPLNGRPVMTTLDCTMIQIEAGGPTRPFQTSASAICVAVEGNGVSKIGAKAIRWEPNDIFTLPQWNWISHQAISDKARLFIVSNREAYGQLGLLREDFG